MDTCVLSGPGVGVPGVGKEGLWELFLCRAVLVPKGQYVTWVGAEEEVLRH